MNRQSNRRTTDPGHFGLPITPDDGRPTLVILGYLSHRMTDVESGQSVGLLIGRSIRPPRSVESSGAGDCGRLEGVMVHQSSRLITVSSQSSRLITVSSHCGPYLSYQRTDVQKEQSLSWLDGRPRYG
ncbi:hypothetical protein BV898_15966 [Hypsibius exemplaris]|uniref:Uncharacterized protein n=1 Tax=Hypsibius exemplaris TaxID=2072580 RepID=A0A9X6RL22_HYPEX|nr:hypothetical protein BV898_15966 [Hypsibius exemplaris]